MRVFGSIPESNLIAGIAPAAGQSFEDFLLFRTDIQRGGPLPEARLHQRALDSIQRVIERGIQGF